MPRVLDAALLAAMESGNFTPYFNVQLMASNKTTVEFHTTEVLGFELEGLTAKAVFYDPDNFDGYVSFRIQRGITLAGVPNIITSSCFHPTLDRNHNHIRTLEGHVFPNQYVSTAGDVNYKTIIDAVCANFGFTTVYEAPAAAWLDYQFLPDGKNLTLNDAKSFFTILRQKYLVFATDYDDDVLYFYQAKNAAPAFPAGYTKVEADFISIPLGGAYKYKTLISRDEGSTVHTSGGANKPIHNLGFLHSTASHPDRYTFVDTPDWLIQNIPPNLKYLDFDAIYANTDISTCLITPSKFREIYNPKFSPAWQWQARYLDIFGNTEGGALPSTIEAAAPYTPLNTSNFAGVLGANDNNIQAAIETLDDHSHSSDYALMLRRSWLKI